MANIVDPKTIPARVQTIYPPEFADAVAGRAKQALTQAAGLTQFGVNLTTLEPGSGSSHRHWHASEDEFIYVLDGDITLITDAGEQTLSPGMAAGFPAGDANGHQLVNRGTHPVRYLEIGTRAQADTVTYSDVDMAATKVNGTWHLSRKDGTPFP
jgi:uncharacterized cupin superfamily protein